MSLVGFTNPKSKGTVGPDALPSSAIHVFPDFAALQQLRSMTVADDHADEGKSSTSSAFPVSSSLEISRSSQPASSDDTVFVREVDHAEAVYTSEEWDGRVTKIGKSTFTGTMAPVGSRPGAETEEITYPLDLLTRAERQSLRLGSIFRFTVGRARTYSGKMRPHASVYFRPASSVNFKRAEQAVGELSAFFATARQAETKLEADDTDTEPAIR